MTSIEAHADEDTGRYEWMGSTEAAAYLGIGPRALYRFIDEGDLPA